MANLARRVATKPSSLGSASNLRLMPDGSYRIAQPTAAATGKNYRDMVRLEIFGRKSSVRAQPRRMIDMKTGQLVQARTGEDVLRDRPAFIREAMLSENPELRQIVAEEFRNADPEIKQIIAQEIAERFPAGPQEGGVSIGWSPQAREIMDFLQTGQLSPERMQAIEAARVDAPGIAQTSERTGLGGGNPDIAAETFDLDPDVAIDTSPEANIPYLDAPPDPLLDDGTRPFPAAQGVDTKLVNDRLENRPYLRTGAGAERVRGDKVNPKKERFSTELEVIDGRRTPVRQAPDPSAGSIGPQDNPAINAAERGRRPYPVRDLEANRSVAEGGEQRALAEALDQLGRGQTGAEDRVWNLVKRKSNPALSPSDLNSGVPDAETLVDHALSLITDPNVRGMIASSRGFDGWRAQAVDALNQRFWAPEGSVERLTPDEVAARDAAFDSQAGDPDAEWGLTELRPDSITPEQQALYEQARDDFLRATKSDSYYADDVPLASTPVPPRVPPPATPIGPDANVGRAGEPQSLRASQAQDPFPGARTETGGMQPGISQQGRPVSQIPGRGPSRGKGYNRDVDDLPARYDITATSERDPIRLRDGEELAVDDGTRVYSDDEGNVEIAQADPQELAQRQSALYAHSQGRVVYNDPDTGNLIARQITPIMKPDSINKIRALARMQFPEGTQAAFESMWPAGEPPLPEYYDWAQNPTPAGRQLSEATPAPPSSQAEIDAGLAEMRAGDEAALANARDFYSQFGFPRDRIPPGFITRPRGGRVVRNPFGFDDPWDEVERIIQGADGTPIPEPAAGAPEIAQEVARIYSDPTASPEDMAWAQSQHQELASVLDEINEPDIRARYEEDIVRPMQEARAQSEEVVASDDYNLGSAIEEESAAVVTPADPAPPQAGNVDEALDAAASEIGDPAAPPSATGLTPEVEQILRDSGYVLDPNTGQFVKQDAQPSTQSADNTKPQEPPKQVEAEAAASSDAAETPRDTEATKADAESRIDATDGDEAKVEKQAEEKLGWGTRAGRHVRANAGRYAAGAAAAGAGAMWWNSDRHSMPHPNAFHDFPRPQPASQQSGLRGSPAPGSSEERIRALRNRFQAEGTIRKLRGY